MARALDLKDQGVWGVADAARVFLGAIVKYLTQRGDEMGNAVFDKVRGLQHRHGNIATVLHVQGSHCATFLWFVVLPHVLVVCLSATDIKADG